MQQMAQSDEWVRHAPYSILGDESALYECT
jgi:hypothetical protein